MLTNRTIKMGVGILTCALLAGGCGSYYKVKDPQTGNVYYTEDLKERSGGSVSLRDGKTGDQVTLQNSQVQSISKESFETLKRTSGENPEAKAKAAAEQQRLAEARAAENRAAEQRAAEQRAAEQRAAAEAKAKEANTDEATLAGATAAGVAGAAVAAKPAVTAQQMRSSLVAARDQVDRTLASLTDLTDPNQADLRAAYKRYGEQVDRMKAHAQQTKADADGMRQTREAYFAKWDAKIAATDNPTIRGEAEAKRARLRTAQEKIVADAALAKEAYQPFMTDLEDTRKFLANDVSKDTISVLSPTAKKAQQNGQMLNQRLETLIADLDAVEGGPTTKPSPARGSVGGDSVTPRSEQPAPASPLQ